MNEPTAAAIIALAAFAFLAFVVHTAANQPDDTPRWSPPKWPDPPTWTWRPPKDDA